MARRGHGAVLGASPAARRPRAFVRGRLAPPRRLAPLGRVADGDRRRRRRRSPPRASPTSGRSSPCSSPRARARRAWSRTSALVMRHVGVRLGAVRALGARDRPRFLDVGRRSLVVSEVLTSVLGLERLLPAVLQAPRRRRGRGAGHRRVPRAQAEPARPASGVRRRARRALRTRATTGRPGHRDGDDGDRDDGSAPLPLEPPSSAGIWWGEGDASAVFAQGPSTATGFHYSRGAPAPAREPRGRHPLGAPDGF